MAAADIMANVATGKTTGAILTVGVMILVGIMAIVLCIGIIWLMMRWRKYNQFRCVIYEYDGLNHLNEFTDKAGIFVDKKTNNKRLFLKKSNVGLNADNIPYIRGAGNQKTIYMYKDGLKNFHFLKYDIKSDKFEIDVGEEDVNWAVNAYERQKKMFSNSLLMQLMPYLALAVVSITILIIFIYFFKDFAVLRDMALALKEAAVAIAQAKSGTTVITG
jgi:hypothetical protein